MAKNLFITATEAQSGKSAVCLGVMEMLLRKTRKVGFFRPIVRPDQRRGDGQDHDINLMATHYQLGIPPEQMYAFTAEMVASLLSQGREGEIIEGIIRKYNQLAEQFDFVLCEGTDYAASTSAFEFDVNAEISKNLGAPVLLVANAYQKSLEETFRSIELSWESLFDRRCEVVATIVNRVEAEDREQIIQLLQQRDLTIKQLVYAIPNVVTLGNPTVGEIAKALGAKVLFGADQLNRHVYGFIVAAMQLRNLLPRIEHGSLIITPGDRADVIVACLAAVSSMSMSKIAGIVLTGGLIPEDPIMDLIKRFPKMVPILSVQENTFPAARLVDEVHAQILPENERKITMALSVFDKNINVEELAERIIETKTTIVTPKMFEFGLLQKARKHKQHIVLPEGAEPRILRAAERLLRRDVVDLTLLGDEMLIREKIDQLNLRLEGLTIINPLKSDLFEEYVQTYYELRKHRGITLENARDTIGDFNYFGTMMIYKGHADGMVSGAVHTTAATIRPALEIVKTKPGFSIVSSVFFMCLPDQVLVYGDCAINPDPDSRQLAEIALNAAQTAKTFGIEPVVAMLSYSTGESGRGADVEKVREAARIAKEMALETWPDLKIEGPLQYDAAVDLAVAMTKMPESEVAGRATVFIFPDLNTGNNTYKAVQRSSGAVAIGPILQGLRKPVNDLSRGCTVADILNTVAI
ncbi:MAG: phosphate acetyltransferase, partial [Pseudomonadota bacterium]